VTRPERLIHAVAKDGPGVVVLNWTPAHGGLLDELARTMLGAGVARITCVGDASKSPAELPREDGIEVRKFPNGRLGIIPALDQIEAAAKALHAALEGI